MTLSASVKSATAENLPSVIIDHIMKSRLIPLTIFLIFSVLLFVFSKNISYPFEYLGSLLVAPRAVLYSSAHAAGKPSETDLLQEENTKLRTQLVNLTAIKNDNAALRSQFQDTVVPPQSLLPAKIIGFQGNLETPTVFILDQGGNSGIKTGQAVILGHILVGKIGMVTPFTAEVLLSTNKNFSTLGSTGNNSSGIINGQEDFILLNNVVITDTLIKNGTVVTKGEEDKNGIGIPPNLLVGKIISVSKSESEPFQSAIVKPLISFNKLTTVFVIK